MPATIHVIATTKEGTRAALARSKQLSAAPIDARVILLVPRIVSLESPPDGPEEVARISEQYRQLAAEAGVDASVRLCVGQRYRDVFRFMLGKEASVVVGGRRRWWWHTAEQDLERELRRAGHSVVFADVAKGLANINRLY